MAVTVPKLSITFSQLATSLIERSQRGYAIIVVREETTGAPYTLYNQLAEIEADSAKYTATNMQHLRDVYAVKTPYRVAVIRIGADDAFAAAAKIIEDNIATGWVTVAGGTGADMTAIKSWIESMSQVDRTYKAVVNGITAPDTMRLVNLANSKVTFADDRGEQDAEAYLPTLCGIFAACNVEQGCTNLRCTNLKAVTPVANVETALREGGFVLYNSTDGVYILQGNNSMTTANGNTRTEDMMYIETVEAMDMILDDIRAVWRDQYLGKYRNKLDNQMLLIAAINAYFRDLARENILDDKYNNFVEVDVAAQRSAWLGTGKAEAAEWSDAKVREMAFKRDVFLRGDIKILGSMTNLTFAIALA